MTKKRALLYIFLIVMVLDLLLLCLLAKNYDVIFLKKSNYLAPIILNIVVFFLVVKKSRGVNLVLVILSIILCFWLLIINLWTEFFHSYSYEEITSPQKSNVVIIEHRNSLIDQNISNYKIYQKKYGILMKELTKKDIIITVPYIFSLSQKEIFDFEEPIWINEKKVIFNTLEDRYKFNLD